MIEIYLVIKSFNISINAGLSRILIIHKSRRQQTLNISVTVWSSLQGDLPSLYNYNNSVTILDPFVYWHIIKVNGSSSLSQIHCVFLGSRLICNFF